MKRLAISVFAFSLVVLTAGYAGTTSPTQPPDGNPCSCLVIVDGKWACLTNCGFKGYMRQSSYTPGSVRIVDPQQQMIAAYFERVKRERKMLGIEPHELGANEKPVAGKWYTCGGHYCQYRAQ